MDTLNPQKSQQYKCEICNLTTNNKKDYNKHLSTLKQINRYNLIHADTSLIEDNLFNCKCGNSYKYSQGLSKHKKTCSLLHEPSNHIEINSSNNVNCNDTTYLTMMMDILKQNSDFKELIIEQNKQMMEMVKEGKTINNTNNNNTTNNNNNKFNLNIFLNEKCKDAMNIMDFANSLEIGLKELEDVGTLGYATGIGNIIIRGLKDLDVYKRPIHCSDLKRESMHVKDKNIWILDKDKTLLDTAIKRVARKNILKVHDWKQANPEYSEVNSKTMDKYGQILIEATGSFEPDEKEKDLNKIIRIIAKEVMIEK
jgi:hypothetical protein